jgi:hypothetical protein
MTARFQAELAKLGRDWIDANLSDQAAAYIYEQIAPDETVVASGIVPVGQRTQMTSEFLAKDNQNVIVFYPLFSGDLPSEYLAGGDD